MPNDMYTTTKNYNIFNYCTTSSTSSVTYDASTITLYDFDNSKDIKKPKTSKKKTENKETKEQIRKKIFKNLENFELLPLLQQKLIEPPMRLYAAYTDRIWEDISYYNKYLNKLFKMDYGYNNPHRLYSVDKPFYSLAEISFENEGDKTILLYKTLEKYKYILTNSMQLRLLHDMAYQHNLMSILVTENLNSAQLNSTLKYNGLNGWIINQYHKKGGGDTIVAYINFK